MSIHIHVGYNDNPGKGPFTPIMDLKFLTAEAATQWYTQSGFAQDEAVLNVIRAATDEYVGTEHELMQPDGKSYTNMFLCIEGREGKDTFDRRLPDLHVEEIVVMGDGHYQLNGTDLDGKRTWQSVYTNSNVRVKPSEVAHLPE